MNDFTRTFTNALKEGAQTQNQYMEMIARAQIRIADIKDTFSYAQALIENAYTYLEELVKDPNAWKSIKVDIPKQVPKPEEPPNHTQPKNYSELLENTIVQQIQSLIGKYPIFQKYAGQKVYIRSAVQYTIQDQSMMNLWKLPIQNSVLYIYGTLVNGKLEGRGVVLFQKFIEDGFFEKGSLVWGTRVYEKDSKYLIEKSSNMSTSKIQNFIWNYADQHLDRELCEALSQIRN